MIHLEKTDHRNVWDIIELRVFESQEEFVAPNDESLMEAYIAVTSEDAYAYPFGIYNDDTPVGFLMIGYNEAGIEENAPEALKNNYSLWRLMIDRNHQGKGYGREAVRLALEFIRTWPGGKAEYCALSYEPENTVAAKLYHSFGFEENGEMDGDEIVAVLKL
ncbi:MAG: GNAT family N-acetyltransferase [Lachnospiraceae bacterium]|nr:GNAT family N-acetyltransferase [Lachnospiraceae bacterium]